MSEVSTHRRGPGRPHSLDRGRILDTAAAILSAEGVAALSMPRLARSLGCPTATLYGYVRSKQSLIDALVDRAMAELPRVPPAAMPWDERVAAFFGQLRALLLRHTDLAALLADQPVAPESALPQIESCLRALRDGGLDRDAAGDAYFSLFMYTLGHALWESSRLGRESSRERLRALQQRSDLVLFPYAARRALDNPPDQHFATGLRALLAGLTGAPARSIDDTGERTP